MTYSKSQALALLILRLVIAAIFFVAAYYKISFWTSTPEDMTKSMGNLMKFLSIVESLGAFALVIGYLTRWAAAGLAIIMVGVIYKSLFDWSTGFVTPTGAGWNFNLMILAGCIILIAFGAGNLSVDWVRKNKG